MSRDRKPSQTHRSNFCMQALEELFDGERQTSRYSESARDRRIQTKSRHNRTKRRPGWAAST